MVARGAGRLYRPMKKAVSLRLDADVIAWLKRDGKGIPDAGERRVAGVDAEGDCGVRLEEGDSVVSAAPSLRHSAE